MTTDDAQRRLLEALAVLDSVEDGTRSFLVALDSMVPSLAEIHPELTAVFVEVGTLAAAASFEETEVPGASRRLLEALAVLDERPAGIGGLLVGLGESIGLAEQAADGDDMDPLIGVWSALSGLAKEVQLDQKERV